MLDSGWLYMTVSHIGCSPHHAGHYQMALNKMATSVYFNETGMPCILSGKKS